MCIYGIMSKTTCRLYVGSAVNFKRRKDAHLTALKHGKHYNSFLQNHCDKYGVSDLLFYIIKKVENREDLIKEEQYYIDNLKPCFNICKIADRRTGITLSEIHKQRISAANKGRIVSEETRQKQREIFTGRKVTDLESIQRAAAKRTGQKRTDETKAKMSKASKGRKKSPETIKKMSIALTGRKLSEEHKKKIIPTGRIASAETRKKMAAAIERRKLNGTYKINKTKVIQMNLQGEEMFIWESASLAARVNGMDGSFLLAVARGRKGKTAKGFKWKVA